MKIIVITLVMIMTVFAQAKVKAREGNYDCVKVTDPKATATLQIYGYFSKKFTFSSYGGSKKIQGDVNGLHLSDNRTYPGSMLYDNDADYPRKERMKLYIDGGLFIAKKTGKIRLHRFINDYPDFGDGSTVDTFSCERNNL
ncbi:MAG: hypothetical protein AB7O96_05630 [Pseudobdellovibrionaceae bacterium]